MCNNFRPTRYMLTAGVGIDKYALVAFDKALLNSRIANYNLVRVSSILPPKCVEQASIGIEQGSILYTAYANMVEKGDGYIAAAVAVGIPKYQNEIGVIMECSLYGRREEAEHNVSEMVKESMRIRKIEIDEIKVVSVEAPLLQNEYTAVFAAVAMW